jgi:hypothetical protein
VEESLLGGSLWTSLHFDYRDSLKAFFGLCMGGGLAQDCPRIPNEFGSFILFWKLLHKSTLETLGK